MAGASVVLFDYGSGNLRSAYRALVRAGAEVRLTSDRDAALAADGLVLPGVGAYAACMEGLAGVCGDEIIRARVEQRRAVLGICVGHQIMFGAGVEHGVETAGIGVLPGRVERLRARRLPHMGWNDVEVAENSTIFAGVQHERFYFVHSYGVILDAELPSTAKVTTCQHEGESFVAAVEFGSLTTTQFHPEKSGDAGARLLANWVEHLPRGES